MSRVWMAFAAFFSLLFRGRLPARAELYLPSSLPSAPSPATSDGAAASGAEATAQLAPVDGEPRAAAAADVATGPPEPQAGRRATDLRTEGALMLLTLLQREGRLIDFLRESLDAYDDATVGVAFRSIHRDCRKVLDAHVKVEPVMPGQEDEAVSLPRGFDPAEVRVIGNALGDPPWKGVLVHHGWRVVEAKLPILAGEVDRHVIAPAEVKLD